MRTLACAAAALACVALAHAQAPAAHEHHRAEPSRAIAVAGDVLRPGAYDAGALASLPRVTQAFAGRSYTGVTLWDFLDRTVGLRHPGAKPGDLLRMYVVATGTDGYQVVISMGEIAPSFGNAPDIIAIEVDGHGLGPEGFARLVVPRDARGGRSVANLARLQVLCVPAAAPDPGARAPLPDELVRPQQH